MKLHLLFSSLFMAALLLSSQAAQAKTHHYEQNIDASKKLFTTGIFITTPTVGLIRNPNPDSEDEWVDAPPIAKNTEEYNRFKNILSIKKLKYKNHYKVHFFFMNWSSGRISECEYNGIFEQKTSAKLLTLIPKEKKQGCVDIVIAEHKREISIDAEDESCSEFCANTSEVYFIFPKEIKNKH